MLYGGSIPPGHFMGNDPRHHDPGHVVPPVDGEQSAADRCGQLGTRRMEAQVAALR